MKPPLAGICVIEFEGLGPCPLTGLMLANMGADVTVIARPGRGPVNERFRSEHDNPVRRGKTVLNLDLKQEAGVAAAMARIACADVLIEGNRPGVMERLGLGPADCAARNPSTRSRRLSL